MQRVCKRRKKGKEKKNRRREKKDKIEGGGRASKCECRGWKWDTDIVERHGRDF